MTPASHEFEYTMTITVGSRDCPERLDRLVCLHTENPNHSDPQSCRAELCPFRQANVKQQEGQR